MKYRYASTFVAAVVFVASSVAFADTIPLPTPTEREGSSVLANSDEADAAFFAAHPEALQIAGQTNTWYENTGGILWLTFTIVVIGVLIAAT